MGSNRYPPARRLSRESSGSRLERLEAVIRALMPGEVVSYGDVADVAGYPRQARLVGRLLATSDLDLPWWRVVNASGRLVPGLEDEQRRLLVAEGVVVSDGRVVTARAGRFAPR